MNIVVPTIILESGQTFGIQGVWFLVFEALVLVFVLCFCLYLRF